MLCARGVVDFGGVVALCAGVVDVREGVVELPTGVVDLREGVVELPEERCVVACSTLALLTTGGEGSFETVSVQEAGLGLAKRELLIGRGLFGRGLEALGDVPVGCGAGCSA